MVQIIKDDIVDHLVYVIVENDDVVQKKLILSPISDRLSVKIHICDILNSYFLKNYFFIRISVLKIIH